MTGRARRRLLLGLAGLAASLTLRAQTPASPPPEVAAALPGARLLGSDLLRFLGLQIYEARLWVGTQPPAADWAAVPYALELRYARSLKGALIAERSLKEMGRQGEIAPADAERWLGRMKQIFPDVAEGDRITGLNLPGAGARFLFNGKPCGEVLEPAFARRFFGIWLAPQTSEPAMRDTLLGRKPP
jgi:hypothetical protein